MAEYYPNEPEGINTGVIMEFRAALAWRLLERFGLVAGKDGGEDSHGRAKITDLGPKEMVDKAYLIADLFMEKTEERGLIRPCKLTEAEGLIRRAKFEWEALEARRKVRGDL